MNVNINPSTGAAVFSNRCGCSFSIASNDRTLLCKEINRLRALLIEARKISKDLITIKPRKFFLNCACNLYEPHSLGEPFPTEPLNPSHDYWINEIKTLRRALAEAICTNNPENQEVAEAIYKSQIQVNLTKPNEGEQGSVDSQSRRDDNWSGAMDAQARWSNNKWYDCHVHERQFDGTYNCYFPGTDTEAYIPPERLRIKPVQDRKRKASHISQVKQIAFDTSKVPAKLVSFVERHMKGFNCGAHDMAHVYRVANVAQKIAALEGANQMIAYIAGLVHDILDSKLIEADNVASAEQMMTDILKNDMTATIPEWTTADADHVIEICKSVGYKNLLKIDWNPQDRSAEYKCVQDADLLDAIGCIGIARCFAFGGKRNRAMFGVSDVVGSGITSEQYKQQSQHGTGVEHFFDKLLLIKDMMTTDTGTKMAKPRHEAMLTYLKSLEIELVDGEVPGAEETDMHAILKLFI